MLLLLVIAAARSAATEPDRSADRDTALRQPALPQPGAPGEIQDQQLAARRGLTLDQIAALHRRFGLSNAELAQLTPGKLRGLIWQLQHPNLDLHAEALKFRRLQLGYAHGQIPPDAWTKAAEQRRQILSKFGAWSPAGHQGAGVKSAAAYYKDSAQPKVAGIQSSNWTWLGPGNIGGRVRSILVHPTVSGTMWTGGVGGGVWKTINGGASWFPLDDFMANLAIACMALDPTNPNVIYAGTGEGFDNIDAIQGAGIFKSVDGGTNWTQLASTASSSFFYVNRLAISPTNNQTLLAATRSGIFRSLNGGTNWTQSTNVEVLDVQFHPTDGSRAVAGGRQGLALFSLDGGVTWSKATGLAAPTSPWYIGRVELAYARSSPTTVYASLDYNSGTLYRSTDGGQTYSLRNSGKNYLGDQGWYGNAIWVDPTNANNLIVGGIDLWRSINAGSTLTQISQGDSEPLSAHADHHAIVSQAGFDGVNVTSAFFGNDGGIYQAANVYTVSQLSGWTDLNNNLGITEFYGGAANAASGTVAGGTQDNGTLTYLAGAGTGGWTTMNSGDGGFCAADQTNPNYFYGEYVNLDLYRSIDGGNTSDFISGQYWNGSAYVWKSAPYVIPDAESGSANFIAPFVLDPNQPNRILAGGLSLWRSNNAKAPNTATTGPSWASIKGPISGGADISAIAIAAGNSDIVWVGYNDGSVYASTNGTAASPAWTQVNLNTPNLPSQYCSRITIDPFNPSQVYVTFSSFGSGNLWRTTDGGQTWSDLSGGLPQAPVYSLVLNSANDSFLYAGTEVGVFASTNGGATWSANNDGPANVVVEELFWMGNNLVAATHGRGVFSSSLTIMPPVITWVGTAGDGNWFNQTNWSPMTVPTSSDVVQLITSNLTIPATAQFAVFDLIGGTLTGTYTNSATLNWTGGTLGGAWTIASGGVLNLSGSNPKTLAANSTLLNAGTITWSGTGTLVDNNLNPGSALNNLPGGLFQIQSATAISSAGLGGASLAITNAGTLRKSGGTNTTSLGSGSFVNSGTIDVQSGALSFGSGYSQTASGFAQFEIGGLAQGSQYGQLLVNGATTLSGALQVNLVNGYVPAYGDTLALLNYSSFSGVLGSNSAAHLGLTQIYSPTNLLLSCTNVSGLVAVWVTTNFPAVGLQQHGLLDSPFGDAVPNLLKYATGVALNNPTDRSQEAVPAWVSQSGNSYLTLSFKQRSNPGLLYIPEVSGDRLTWYSDAGHVQLLSLTPLDSVFDLAVAQDLTPITAGTPRFMRLRVSAPGN